MNFQRFRQLANLQLEVEIALLHCATDEEKVAVFLEAMDRVEAARGNPLLHVAAGIAGGGAMAADTALMQASAEMLLSLARKHGVEDAWHAALMQHRGPGSELDGAAGDWGSGVGGAPLETLTCANIDVRRKHVCTGPASFVCG